MDPQFASRLEAVFGALNRGQSGPLWTVSGKDETRPGTGHSSEEAEEDEQDAPQPLMRGDVMASDDEEGEGADLEQERPSLQYSK